MTELGTTWEREDLGGGKFRHEQHLRPICYSDGGILRRIVSDWVDGDATFPHACLTTLMPTYMAGDGMFRICPTREPDVWASFGGPYIKPAAQWNKVNLGTATRSGNVVSWSTAQADVRIAGAGHFLKVDIPLKGGWQPPNGQVAFPVGMNGLTRTGSVFYKNGVPVMTLRPPTVYDAANTEDVRQIAYDIVRVSGQWYVLLTLPSLTGMTSPVIDPSPLTLQPDATAGKDTKINSASGSEGVNYSMGVSYIAESTSKGLIEFDISSIPATATCDSCTYYNYHTSSGAAVGWTVSFYSIAVGNADWPEGTKDAAAGGAGDCCWNYKDQGGAGTAWAGSAGLGSSGTDYEAGALGSFSGNRSDAAGTEYSTTLTASRVEDWFGSPNTNYGLLGVPTAATGGLASSDHGTAGYRPKIVVEYTEAAPSGNPWYAYAQQ